MADPGTPDNPLRVAIVGSGPAGFYAAEALLNHPELDYRGRHDRPPADPLRPRPRRRRSRPPEDQERDQALREDRRPRGVPVLRQRHASAATSPPPSSPRSTTRSIWAYGAGADRQLGIAGEDLPGSHAATEFVAWYNGHPDFADREFDLDCERVVVIGNGNVAADVARMLVLTREELEATDTAHYAIEALAESRRRGGRDPRPPRPRAGRVHQPRGARARRARPTPTSSSTPPPSTLDEASRALPRVRRTPTRPTARTSRRFTGFAEPRADRASRSGSSCASCAARLEIHGDGRVERIVVGVNELYVDDAGAVRARDTGETETIECGLVLRSIGYLGTGIDGVPHDARGRRHPERAAAGSSTRTSTRIPGQYVVGWIKRGPERRDRHEQEGRAGDDRRRCSRTSPRAACPSARPATDEPARAARASAASDFVEFDGWRGDRRARAGARRAAAAGRA